MYNGDVETIPDRTFRFGVAIVKLAQLLPKNSAGFAVSDQIIRAGTSVGANVEESQNAPTKKDFVRGMTIALKEARETGYWLRIISESGMLAKEQILPLILENTEIVRILIASVKSTKSRYNLG